MPDGQLDNVVRHVRRAACLSEAQPLTDGQLLERYVASRDENAFATLVRRYGRLVRSLCRHILHHEQDIDDAFQVTWMVFASRAASIRRSASVASWLYGVAYRTAMNARRARMRHSAKQARAKSSIPEQPVTEAALRELQAILDEEVHRLPQKYRAPFILCCLEGKSRAEAARQLGLKEGTVSSRLAQARKDLQRRLARRGVVFSAALCAVELARSGAAASVPPALVKATIKGALSFAAGKTATGLVSAEVIALARGVMQNMFATTLEITAAALLAVGLAAGAVLLTCHEIAGKPQAGEPQQRSQGKPLAFPAQKGNAAPSAAREGDNEALTIRGRVLDPDGKPLPGAKLYLAKPASRALDAEPALAQQGVSGPDGSFRFSVAPSVLVYDERQQSPAQVMAVAAGHGCDWVALSPAQTDVTLRLVKDVPIRVRILDLDGRPVAGARLKVMSLWAPRGNDLGGYLDAVRKNVGRAPDRGWKGPLPGQPAVVTTGRDGRFHLAGAGRERVVHFRLEGPGIAAAALDVMTRAADSVARGKSGGIEMYGASSDFVASASRPIQGVVRDRETGKPVAGVSIHTTGSWAQAITDSQGRYQLLGEAKKPHYALYAEPPDGLHFRRGIDLPDTPGFAALTCDVELVRGLIVRGRVTDRQTGKPIAGARAQYWPLGGNPYVNKLLPGSWGPTAWTTTRPDGSYTITVMPGPGAIAVTAPKREQYQPAAVPLAERKAFFKAPLIDDGDEWSLTLSSGGGSWGGISLAYHNAIVLLEPGEKEDRLVRDVALQQPLQRHGRIVGPDGRPLAGVQVCGLVEDGVPTMTGAEFTVRGINPHANRVLVFYRKEKDLGFYLKDLRAETVQPLTVKLQPCGSASGRVVRPDGRPAAGLRCFLDRLDYSGGRGHARSEGGGCQEVITDREGRFRIKGLVPGQEYRMARNSDRRPGYLNLFAPVKVKPGEHKEMGDLKMDRDD